ncbi:hypothetical protein EBR21_17475 [bacterium]|nr:hypothetical protein [bacterium]
MQNKFGSGSNLRTALLLNLSLVGFCILGCKKLDDHTQPQLASRDQNSPLSGSDDLGFAVISQKNGTPCFVASPAFKPPRADEIDGQAVLRIEKLSLGQPNELKTPTTVDAFCDSATVSLASIDYENARKVALASNGNKSKDVALSVAPVVVAGTLVACAAGYLVSKSALCRIKPCDSSFVGMSQTGIASIIGGLAGAAKLAAMHSGDAALLGVSMVGNICIVGGVAGEIAQRAWRARTQGPQVWQEQFDDFCGCKNRGAAPQ